MDSNVTALFELFGSSSEALAIFLWGIALVLLSVRLRGVKPSSRQAPVAVDPPTDHNLIARTS